MHRRRSPLSIDMKVTGLIGTLTPVPSGVIREDNSGWIKDAE
jgi:hypothetical protein